MASFFTACFTMWNITPLCASFRMAPTFFRRGGQLFTVFPLRSQWNLDWHVWISSLVGKILETVGNVWRLSAVRGYLSAEKRISANWCLEFGDVFCAYLYIWDYTDICTDKRYFYEDLSSFGKV